MYGVYIVLFKLFLSNTVFYMSTETVEQHTQIANKEVPL